jgi:two-component system sensor histidine kinase PilS (NtrC family)
MANFQALLHYFTIYSLTFFLVAILSSMLSTRLQKTEAELFQTASDYDQLFFLYKQIFDDINTGIITVDADNRITSFNRAAERITGYGAGETLGRKLPKAFPELKAALPDDERRQMAAISRKNGETIPVGYSCSRLTALDENKNGSVYTLQDLSQIKKMEGQIQQAEKMATIGEMAAGIAHELRNPLAAISGAAQLLDKETQDGSVNKRLYDIILRESDRLDATIHEFLLFSKPVKPEKEWFSMRALAQEAMETLVQNPGWNHALTIDLEISPELDSWGDPQLLRQVLLNLVGNSANACRNMENGRILLRAGERKIGDKETLQAAIVLEIVDNGPGIPEDIQERIFEPFFTTRETGTGLGLAIVRQIVHSHGGEIFLLDSQPQETIFSVRLPLP